MKEDEDIAAYFLRVDEIVNAIIGLGEEIIDDFRGEIKGSLIFYWENFLY
jgi:hypothetical protein